ncbi:MAG: D-alanyl-D-alanine carboxypeptidase, partial [Pseudomonadota bacterium]
MASSMENQLQALLDGRPDDSPGALLGVRAPFIGLNWRGAAGAFDGDADAALAVSDGFRIASMSKTFTGVL